VTEIALTLAGHVALSLLLGLALEAGSYSFLEPSFERRLGCSVQSYSCGGLPQKRRKRRIAMRSLISLRQFLFFSILGTGTLAYALSPIEQGTKNKPANSAAGRGSANPETNTPKHTHIMLPTAHAGQPYVVHAYIPSTFVAGWIDYTLDPAPRWLRFEESTSTFHGVPDENSSATYQGIILTLKSTANPNVAPQVFTFTLPVVVGADVAFPEGMSAAINLPVKIPSDKGIVIPPDSTVHQALSPAPAILRTSSVGTTTMMTAGKADPTSRSAPQTETEVATARSPINSPGYSLGPPKPPDDSVIGVRVVTQALIPLPSVRLAGSLSAGQTVIFGSIGASTLPASPSVAVAPDPKAGTAGSPGNLPSLAVEITDPLTKLATRAPLVLPGSSNPDVTQAQVNPEGNFSLSLKTPLSSGQSIRIIAIPPKGYAFALMPSRNECAGGASHLNASLISADECVVLPSDLGQSLIVFSSLSLTAPVITSKLGLNATTISGIATPSTTGANGTTVLIAVERRRVGDLCDVKQPNNILTSHNLDDVKDCGDDVTEPRFADLTVAAAGSTPASTAKTVQTQSNGSFSLTLASPLAEEEQLRIVQILPPGTTFIDEKLAAKLAFSSYIAVPSVADWGRVRAEFTAGLLTTNNNQLNSSDAGSFNQAHLFVDLTLEKVWTLPGCYLQDDFRRCLRPPIARSLKKSESPLPENWWQRHHPGISSYFGARTTAIPVSSVGSSAAPANGSSTGGSASASTLLTGNYLTTPQTAQFGAGVYMPTLLQRWAWRGTPNALFIAPIAKIGFNTVTGPTSINVPAGTPGASAAGSVTLESLYNSWSFGGRLGHFNLSRSENRSPELESFIDVSYGPYSNLQSYICKVTPANQVKATTTNGSSAPIVSTIQIAANGYPQVTSYPGSKCAADYPDYYVGVPPSSLMYTIPTDTSTVTYTDQKIYSFQPWDSRKRLYRLNIVGMLKIPMTPLNIGFSANLGQKAFGASKLDHGYAAPDDLEILFGTRFDIGQLLGKIGVNPF
jgi:hypothetical protein